MKHNPIPFVVHMQNVETGLTFPVAVAFTLRWAKETAKRYYRWIGEGGVDMIVRDNTDKVVYDIPNVVKSACYYPDETPF